MKTDASIVAPCAVLDWDSEFFGCRIASVDPASARLDGLAAVEEWCRGERVRCAYLLLAADDAPAIDAAQRSGFRLVDVRVTLGRTMEAVRARERAGAEACDRAGSRLRAHDGAGDAGGGLVVRPAVPADVPALRAIARGSHHDTRFYADSHFDRPRCDDLYEVWIEKSCRGWADHVVVGEAGARAVGYVSCHLREWGGQIGLVGVDAALRGRGCGSAMIEAAFRWFAQCQAPRVTVVTQGRNTGALRLYQRFGMSVEAVQLWFHKWFASGESN